MKYLVLGALVVLYVIVWGQNWTWFAGAIMFRALVSDRTRSMDRTRSIGPATT
ncbi:MAG: hypothetical protein H0U69_08815 [Trueperaceae bacterium]|nr:hypothetical protein [Trueperaceae bacterium]